MNKQCECENTIRELQDRIERLEEKNGLKCRVVKYDCQNPTEVELLKLVEVGSTVYCSKEAALEILNACAGTFVYSLNPLEFTLYLNKNYLPKDAHITILADEKMKYEDYLFRMKE